MPEKEEKKDIIKQKEGKPSLWQKIKKPLITGVMTAGLSVTPVKNIYSYNFGYNRGPPQGKEWVKRIEEKYPQGWKYILDTDQLLNKKYTEGLSDKAVEYFKQKYEKTKDDDALYLYAYSLYLKANDSYFIKDAEYYLKRTIEICDIPAKSPQINEEKLALKLFSYYALGYSFFTTYENSKYVNKERAETYLLEGLNIYEEEKGIFSKDDQKWFEEEGIIKRIKELLIEIRTKN